MPVQPMTPMRPRKSTTTISDGSVYKDRFTLPQSQPRGTTVRQVFFDSAGEQVAEVVGTVQGRIIDFHNPYLEVQSVPNAAGFITYIQRPDEGTDEHQVRYGKVFRRDLTFPNSPSSRVDTTVKIFEDNFQRPAGPVGGRWGVLVGRPRIFDNTEWFGFGEDHPNTVGPDFNFFTSYFMRFYQPFNQDTVDISLSATKKGNGQTVVAWGCNSTGTSYRFLRFNGQTNMVDMGIGTGPDIGTLIAPTASLESKITPVSLTVPGDDGIATYKLTYDDVTRDFAFWNADKTTKICHWTDADEEVPTGKGYRYFAIGGNAGLFDSGVQLAFIKAAGGV